MAYRFRLIVLFFLSFLSFNSFAAFPLPPQSFSYDSTGFAGNGCTGGIIGPKNESRVSACSAMPPLQCGTNTRSIYYSSGAGGCFASGLGQVPDITYPPSCPENSTLSGNQCICNSGYEEKNGNSCVLPEPPDLCESLAEKCETLNGSKKWITGLRRDVGYKPFKTCTPAGLVPGCDKGCVINSSGNGVFYKDQSGNYYFEGEGTISSETCFPTSEGSGDPPKEEDNPLPPSEPPEKPCKPGEYQGTVNGTKVCLPAKSQETIIKEETINNNDNSTTNINTTVKCENGKCTISETTTDKDSSGATTGESTKETQVSQSDFCAQNPGSSVCKSPGLGKEEGEGEDGKKKFFFRLLQLKF